MVYSGHIFVGDDYVNTYSLAYTLNKFPFFLNIQKANFFHFFPLAPQINNNLRNIQMVSNANIFVSDSQKVKLFFSRPPPPPPPKSRNDGQS